MIEVKNLTKRYGNKLALKNISFTVNDGEILGFLGPNGAGKSTAMNIITGYLSATSGSVSVDGHDVLDEPMAVRKKIGYLPEQPPLYLDMTVKEYLNFVYDLKGCKIPRRAHLNEICQIVRITEVYDRIIKNLSKGYRQRVGIAQALVGNPEVLILDEPTVGLDPNQIIEIRNLIKKLGKRHTVILSSHILPEVQATCDRVVVINKGTVVADNTPDNLAGSLSDILRFNVRIEGEHGEVISLLKSVESVRKVTPLSERESGVYDYIIEADSDSDIRRNIAKAVAEKGFLLLGFEGVEMSLEDVFLKLTKNAPADVTRGGEQVKEAVHQIIELNEPGDDEDEQAEDEQSEASEPEEYKMGDEEQDVADEKADILNPESEMQDNNGGEE